ncbi:MAG TPA: OmpA family protein [Gammaproteobacteria bacterium]|nr:OmpA family protein [Gammaproteobacteria bacterium]
MNIQCRNVQAAAMFAAGFAMLLILGLSAGGARAASGYLTDSAGTIVRNSSGECWHTSQWSAAAAIQECEPNLVSSKEPEAAPVAAMEPEPAPPTMRKISLSADAYFGFDKAELTPEGKEKLDRIAQTLRNAHSPSIRIVGHADRIGPADYNQKLSMQRAQAVKDYFVQQGVSADTIDVSAVGSSEPKVACEGQRGQALIQCLSPNRRTDVEFSAFETVEPNGQTQ